MVYYNSKTSLLNKDGFLYKPTGNFTPADKIADVEVIQVAPTYKLKATAFFLLAFFIFNTQGISRGFGMSNGFALTIAVGLVIVGYFLWTYFRGDVLLKDANGNIVYVLKCDRWNTNKFHRAVKKFLKNKEKRAQAKK